MVKVKASIEIERPAESVYRFIAEDFAQNYPRWSPEVKELQIATEGPLRVGSVGRQVRVDQGRRTESVFYITQMEPAQRLTFESDSPSFLVDYRFAPDTDARTQLTFTFELRRLDLMMRPFEKLIRRAVQDGARRTVRNLKRLIESEREPAAA
ncbi:MAG: SRPBCC family protein [Lamprobacter sp.]|uniref:SRPBCC family protein n=1 Tax=Lamprobacter sp. TaxID=3100796 RepID=UPI002B25E204|nr:SRPBCC family protein [Lamprobacter sp.]MEA3639068.1 SRPBCC family protein [Lamprobacter sp.]